MKRDELRVRSNVLFGFRIGLLLATVFSIWATIVRLAMGPGGFDRFGLSWIQVVALYYLALSAGGVAYGAVEPLRRHALGAMLQGFLLVLPPYAAFTIAIGLTVEPVISFKTALLGGVVIAAFGGSVLGLWTWIEEQQRPRQSDRAPENDT